jgi:hypothetical protein
MSFDIGDVAHLSITFADSDGTPTNPTVVTLTVQAPDNTTLTPTPVNDSAGVWHYDLPLSQSGIYRFKWTGTGAIAAVEEGEIPVRASIMVAQPPGTILVSEMIRTGLRLAGLMGAAKRTASPEQLDEGVETLNSMLDQWRARGLRVPSVHRTLFPLVSMQQSYTIGPGGDFDTDRPASLGMAGIVLTNQTPNPEWPMHVLSQEQWAQIRNKGWSSSWPIAIYYEPTTAGGLGTLWLYPIPSTAQSVALYLDAFIGEVTLTETLIMPPGHRKAIEENLALAIANRNPGMARPGPRLGYDAAESLQVIEILNHRPLQRTNDLPLRRGRSNIYGGWSGTR